MVSLSPRFLALWAFCSASVVFAHVTPGRRDFGKPSQLYGRNLPASTIVAPRAVATHAFPQAKRGDVDGSATVSRGSLPSDGATGGISSTLASALTTAGGVPSTGSSSSDGDATFSQLVDLSTAVSTVEDLLDIDPGTTGLSGDRNSVSNQASVEGQDSQGVNVSERSISTASSNPISERQESKRSSSRMASSSASEKSVSKREYLQKARFTKRHSGDVPGDASDDHYIRRRSFNAKRQAPDVSAITDVISDNAPLRVTPRATADSKPKLKNVHSDISVRQSDAASDVDQDVSDGAATVDDAVGASSAASRVPLRLGHRSDSLARTSLYKARSHEKRHDAAAADTGRFVYRRGSSVAVRRQTDMDAAQALGAARGSAATQDQDSNTVQFSEVAQNLGISQDSNPAQTSDASQTSTSQNSNTAQDVTQQLGGGESTVFNTLTGAASGLNLGRSRP